MFFSFTFIICYAYLTVVYAVTHGGNKAFGRAKNSHKTCSVYSKRILRVFLRNPGKAAICSTA
jgi:hypothetical protein